MNSCHFVGRVGQQPQPIGQNGAKLSIAVDQYNSQTQQRETLWVDLIAFGKTAETIGKYVSTGRQIAVECRYSKREYQDSHGNKRWDHSFVIDRLHLLAEAQQRQQGGFQQQAPQQQGPFGAPPQEPNERLW